MQIAPPTPTEAFWRLSKMREMFQRLRDERITHPSISIETREFVGSYYGDMLDALDVAMVAVLKANNLKIAPNLLEDALR
jgi:hypothetical protein